MFSEGIVTGIVTLATFNESKFRNPWPYKNLILLAILVQQNDFEILGDHAGDKDDQFVMDPALLAMYGGAVFFNNYAAPYTGVVDESIVRDYVRKQM